MVLSVLLITLILAGGFIPAQSAYAGSPGPSVQADPIDNSIYMRDFSPNNWVTLAIYESEGGDPIFGPASLPTDEYGGAKWQDDFDLLVGHYIVATDDETGITKTLILIQHTFDLLDFEADVARGTAPPLSTVSVSLAHGDPYLRVEADLNGDWIANFGAAGLDILPFMKGQAQIYDDDGDFTFDEPPRIEYWGPWENQVSTRSFTPNASVSIALYDSPDGILLFGLAGYPTNADGDLSPHLDFGAHSVRPVPGNYLVITDDVSTYSKTLIVPDDTVNPVDYENDLVTGTALPFAPVKAHVDTESGEHYSLDLFADASGNWSADFGAMEVNLDWNADGGAWVLDEDRDETNIPEEDQMEASLTHDWIGYSFPYPQRVVMFEIYDSVGGNLLFGPQEGEFFFGPGIDLVPGNYIVATDALTGRGKDLVLVEASVTLFDRQQDLLEGTAPSGATVEVDATGFLPFWTLYRFQVVADGNGLWSADFNSHGFDITDDMFALARVLDEDYDWTVVQPAPTVGAITAPVDPVQVNTEISASADFTDPLVLDTPEAEWDWGDGTITRQEDVVSPASAAHTYAEPGVYTVNLRVTDDDGGWGESTYQYVVVYDPQGGFGFVTGGGWIDSPVGAYTADPTLTGKATFGFVSKYKKGADTPSGETQFRFTVADLNFHSTSYQWLVVGGALAQFKGSGTINGAGNYGFMLTAVDGNLLGGGQTDKFRIKIWDKASGDTIVYDNKAGESDTSCAATELGGGSIVIHKK